MSGRSSRDRLRREVSEDIQHQVSGIAGENAEVAAARLNEPKVRGHRPIGGIQRRGPGLSLALWPDGQVAKRSGRHDGGAQGERLGRRWDSAATRGGGHVQDAAEWRSPRRLPRVEEAARHQVVQR